jgi:hypothetical protein
VLSARYHISSKTLPLLRRWNARPFYYSLCAWKGTAASAGKAQHTESAIASHLGGPSALASTYKRKICFKTQDAEYWFHSMLRAITFNFCICSTDGGWSPASQDGARVLSYGNKCGICGGRSGTGIGFLPSSSAVPCHYHPTEAPHYHLGDGQWVRSRPQLHTVSPHRNNTKKKCWTVGRVTEITKSFRNFLTSL